MNGAISMKWPEFRNIKLILLRNWNFEIGAKVDFTDKAMHVITSKLAKSKLTLETTKMIGIAKDLHRTSLKFGGKRNY